MLGYTGDCSKITRFYMLLKVTGNHSTLNRIHGIIFASKNKTGNARDGARQSGNEMFYLLGYAGINRK